MKKLVLVVQLFAVVLLCSGCMFSNLLRRQARRSIPTENYSNWDYDESYEDYDNYNDYEDYDDEYDFVFTYDGDFMYPVIDGFKVASDPSFLNEDAALGIARILDGSYFILISEEASSFSSFKEFHDAVYFHTIESPFDEVEILETQDVDTEYWKGKRYFFTGYSDGVGCYFMYDIVASPQGHYVQKFAWTLLETQEKNEESLLRLLNETEDITEDYKEGYDYDEDDTSLDGTLF